jgi:PPOX class probable F420-dependent enzyme
LGRPTIGTVQVEEMLERVAGARVAHLATAGPRGPHIVPITFAVVDGGICTAVDHKPKSGRPLRRLSNIAADPSVAILVDHYEEDWRRLWWVRVDGRAAVLTRGPEKRLALEALTAKYEQYQADPPDGPVIAVTPVRWSSWQG